ncbi:hypothetical protein ACQ86G_00910 [Roseateles chitinivorans]|uniref:hypothetical protein n=1 Tax=Roseateles chitinivorans TaxID=2917965 RepID=UPI003D664FAA
MTVSPASTAPAAPTADLPSHRLQLLPQGLRIEGLPELRSRLLPRLIAALLQAHEQGLARVDSPARAPSCASASPAWPSCTARRSGVRSRCWTTARWPR